MDGTHIYFIDILTVPKLIHDYSKFNFFLNIVLVIE
jgi:hypothetical protein